MFSDFAAYIAAETLQTLNKIFMVSSSRHYWFFMLCYLLIALACYRIANSKGESHSFISYLFPAEIYKHQSVLTDFKIWIVLILFLKLGAFPFIFGAIYSVMSLLERATDLLGPQWQVPRTDKTPTFADRALYTIVFTLFMDFGFFVIHYCQHKISWLWAFHKVHHSAEVLTPFTANRHHPVDYITHATVAFTIQAFGYFLFTRFYGNDIDRLYIIQTSAIHFFYYMSANCRHSHIWLSFGPKISCLFVSPAMHQIHHSTAPQHYDKNFGYVLSIWDWLFRTRYIPVQKEAITVGLLPGEKRYSGFIEMMWRPFVDCFHCFRRTSLWHREAVDQESGRSKSG